MILHNPVIADNISRHPLSVALTFNHQPSKVFKYFHKYLGFKWLPLISSMNFHFSIPNILIEHEVLEIHLQPDKSWSKQVSKQVNFHDDQRVVACRPLHWRSHQESMEIKICLDTVDCLPELLNPIIFSDWNLAQPSPCHRTCCDTRWAHTAKGRQGGR